MHKLLLGFTPIAHTHTTIDNKQKGGLPMFNYYCNGFWFATYDDAREYADILLIQLRVYKAIYTRSEIEAHAAEVTA
jgi:hypothetical protein